RSRRRCRPLRLRRRPPRRRGAADRRRPVGRHAGLHVARTARRRGRRPAGRPLRPRPGALPDAPGAPTVRRPPPPPPPPPRAQPPRRRRGEGPPGRPPALAATPRKARAPRPEERHASAREFADDLARYLGQGAGTAEKRPATVRVELPDGRPVTVQVAEGV